MSTTDRAIIVSELARLIDGDEPCEPARNLARRVVALVEGRDPIDCVEFCSEIGMLHMKYPRQHANTKEAA